MTSLDCRRSEELFSDHLDGSLDPWLDADLRQHLADCAACRELRDALEDVVSALREFPDVAPSSDLAPRVAAAAFQARPVPQQERERFAWPRPTWMQLAAAVAAVAIVSTTTAFAASPTLLGRTVTRVRERTANGGAMVAETAERWIEDLRILRVVVTAAFERRVERVNDRVDDYRRLIEKRRVPPARTEPQPAPDRTGDAGLGWRGDLS